MKKWKLYHWILLGLVFGIATGVLLQTWVHPGASSPPSRIYQFIIEFMNFCGQIFLRLLQMIIIPLVVGSIVVGTAGLGDFRHLGRLGARVLVYYLLTTAIAVTIGLVLANVIKPGLYLSPHSRQQLMESLGSQKKPVDVKPPELKDILIGLVPRNPLQSMAEGDMLPIIIFSLLFGTGITIIAPQKAKFMVDFFDGITDISVALVELIMKLAPIGVWALMALVVARIGLEVLKPLLIFSLVVLGGLLLHVVLIYTSSLRFLSRVPPWEFFRRIPEAMLVAFSTSSSSATLPVSMKVAEKELGIPERIAGFVLPLGATINMDGTALYQGVVTVFLTQLFEHSLTLGDQLIIVLTATLASVGAAGVPSAGIITLVIVLRSVGLSPEGIAIVLGVDRILDMCRTMVNVCGDLVAARYVYTAEAARGTAETVLLPPIENNKP